jgi:hypothetical protein
LRLQPHPTQERVAQILRRHSPRHRSC